MYVPSSAGASASGASCMSASGAFCSADAAAPASSGIDCAAPASAEAAGTAPAAVDAAVTPSPAAGMPGAEAGAEPQPVTSNRTSSMGSRTQNRFRMALLTLAPPFPEGQNGQAELKSRRSARPIPPALFRRRSVPVSSAESGSAV